MELEELDDSSEGPDEAINQGFEHDLVSSLPSSHFRVIKNMAGAGNTNTDCKQQFQTKNAESFFFNRLAKFISCFTCLSVDC